MDDNKPIIQYSTVSDSVYLWIKNAIIQGDFKPGEHIAQERLTKTLGVSRTPVRDAMKRLESEGLLITKPHCGAVVFQLSGAHLKEIYEIRILMEQYCAEKTCAIITDEEIHHLEEINTNMQHYSNTSKEFMQLDRQFHAFFCSLSGCTNALEILEGLWNKCDSFKSIYYSLDGRARDTLAEHGRIITALRERNVTDLKNAIDSHLKDVVKSVSSKINLD